MLSFQVIGSGKSQTIQVHIDAEGLATLLTRIDAAREHGHAHLTTQANGGGELDPETPFGELAIGELIIDWNEES